MSEIELYKGSLSFTADIIRAAAIEIQESGWLRGDWGGRITGPVCIEGALARVAQRSGIEPEALAEALALIQLVLGMSIPSWNDQHAQSKSQVVGMLQETASVAAQRQATVEVPALPVAPAVHGWRALLVRLIQSSSG